MIPAPEWMPKSGCAESDLTISRPYISRSLRTPRTKNSSSAKVSAGAGASGPRPPSSVETLTQSNDPAKISPYGHKRGQDDVVFNRNCEQYGARLMTESQFGLGRMIGGGV